MKVLKKGKNITWSCKVDCSGAGNGGGGCGAKLEVEASDLFETRRYGMDDGYDSYTTFVCPICKTLTDIKDVPLQIKRKLVYRKEAELAKMTA